jgi:ankyrin repeat protein
MKKMIVMMLLLGVQAAYGMDKNDADLFAACEKGAPEQVEAALANGANPNAQQVKTKITPLMEVAESTAYETCCVPIVHALIKAKANVDAMNPILGQTALMMAAARDGELVMNALIAAKANVNIQNENGYTALMAAVEECQPSAVQLLLEHKAEVNAQTVHGSTALGLAKNPSCDPTGSLDDTDLERTLVINMLKRAGGQRVYCGNMYK